MDFQLLDRRYSNKAIKNGKILRSITIFFEQMTEQSEAVNKSHFLKSLHRFV